MFQWKFLAKLAALTMILFILLSNLRPALAALAHLIIVIPPPLKGL